MSSYFVYKATDNREPNIQTLISQRKVDLIINLPTAQYLNNEKTDGFLIRRMAVDHHIPLITNLQIAQVMLQCLINYKEKSSEPILSWREYLARNLVSPKLSREMI